MNIARILASKPYHIEYRHLEICYEHSTPNADSTYIDVISKNRGTLLFGGDMNPAHVPYWYRQYKDL